VTDDQVPLDGKVDVVHDPKMLIVAADKVLKLPVDATVAPIVVLLIDPPVMATADAVYVPPDETAELTNAVVAICVVFVPPVAVGAAGVPVRTGDAKGAYVLAAVVLDSAPVIRASLPCAAVLLAVP
jgi:hypothetical protein